MRPKTLSPIAFINLQPAEWVVLPAMRVLMLERQCSNYEFLPQVNKNGENNMLRNSNCRVTEQVIFQPSLFISCQVTMTVHVQKGLPTLSAGRPTG